MDPEIHTIDNVSSINSLNPSSKGNKFLELRSSAGTKSLLNVSLKSSNSKRTKRELEKDAAIEANKLNKKSKEITDLLNTIVKSKDFQKEYKELSLIPSSPSQFNLSPKKKSVIVDFIPRKTQEIPKTKPFSMLSPKEKSIVKLKPNKANRSLKRFDPVEDSISDLEDEDIATQDNEFYIHPDSNFCLLWDLFMMILSLYAIIFTPLLLAFEMRDIELFSRIEEIMDFIFIFDIGLNFFIAYLDFEENLITNLRMISFKYLSSWFILDSIAAFPTGLVLGFISNESNITSLNKATRLARIYKFMKLTKLTKLLKFIKTTKKSKKGINKIQIVEELNISTKFTRLLKFFVGFMFLSHMGTCIWIFVGREEFGWIQSNQLGEVSHTGLYLASLYFNWTSIFTIGYGDITPQTGDERFFALLIMIVGIGVYSFAVSSLGNIVTSYDTLTERFHEKNKVLDEISKKHRLDYSIYNRIKRYIRYDYCNNKDEQYRLVSNLPFKLRNSIVLSMYSDIIDNCNFLADKSIDFVAEIILKLRFMAIYNKEKIINHGDRVREMFFVKSGKLSVHLSENRRQLKLIEIRKYEHFGDILVLSNEKSPVIVKCASSYSDLMLLSKGDLELISNRYPEMFESIYAVSNYNYSALLDLISKKTAKLEKDERIKTSRLASQASVEIVQVGKQETPKKSIKTNLLSSEGKKKHYFNSTENRTLLSFNEEKVNVFNPNKRRESTENRRNKMLKEISYRLTVSKNAKNNSEDFFKKNIKDVIREHLKTRNKPKGLHSMLEQLRTLNM